MATTTAALPQRSRGVRVQRTIQPYLYLVPAFAVMAIITFYPLFFQVWMSFHDFGQINFRVRNPVPAEFIGLENYIRIAQSKLQIPNFEFVRLVLFNLWWALSNVVVHIIIGVFVAVVSNQSGIARGLLSEEQYTLTAARLHDVFARAGATIDAMYYCPHFPDITGPCECRKPGTLLFRQAAAEHAIDLTRSLYAGDRLRDVLPARALGGFGVLVPALHTPHPELEEAQRDFTVAGSLGEAVRLFLAR